ELRDTYESTTTLGVDLGVAARWELLQAGLTGRNLNAPRFKGFSRTLTGGAVVTYDDVRLDPELTLGGAFIPWDTVTFAIDVDLTRAKTLLPGYRTQHLRLGAEWNILHTLALRGGWSRNLAESDSGALIHGGLGLNLYLLRLDLAAALSTQRVTVDGTDIPREARVALGLATDW
ncbi:MAG: hypothetical protein RLZZ598_1011, partial [Pseudomonadota bacterium]